MVGITLQCFQVADTQLLSLGCFSPDGDIVYSSCAFDTGPFSQCELPQCEAKLQAIFDRGNLLFLQAMWSSWKSTSIAFLLAVMC